MTGPGSGGTGPSRRPPAWRDAGSPRRAGPDPLGKRALFWAEASPEAHGASPVPPPPMGKHALYSTAPPGSDGPAGDPAENPVSRSGPVTVTCQRCATVSRIGYLDLLIYQFPIGFLVPGRRFDHRMTCPACSRRVWASVTFRR